MDSFILVSIAVVLVSLISLFIVIDIDNKRHNTFVKENSITLQKLNAINEKYSFYLSEINYNEQHVYDNENFFNMISCEDYLIYQLQFKKYDIEQEIKKYDYNKHKYKRYAQEVDEAQSFGKYSISEEKYNKKKLLKIEKQLFEQKLKKPILSFSLEVALYCSTINGRIYSHKSNTFSADYITSLIARINNKYGNFYKDTNIWNSICRVERGRVSNKMRFAIYARDGYRCRICGRTERECDLEIDHIKPIAKGGKSTYDNLQTLCSRCNKNKGDKY